MKFLEQWKVTRFCRRAAALSKAKKKQEALRADILKDLENGFHLPDKGPFLIELSPNGGKVPVDWEKLYKDIYTAACIKKFGAVDGLLKAGKKFDEIENSAPAKDPVTILGENYIGGVKFNTRINPNYRVKKSEAA